MDITRVLAQIADGDREAFAEVVDTFQRPLFGFLGRMGLNRDVAAEIAQETFVRAWTNIGQYQDGRAEFSTWLFSIARNLALNELTRASTKYELTTDSAAATAVCKEPGLIDQVEQEQSNARLRQALSRLPLADRTALALVYVRELPLAEIAVLEGTTEGALKARLHRAKMKLRELLAISDD